MNVGQWRRCGLRRLRKQDDGQAAFEFLLMLPIFVLFLLLVVDLGMAMFTYVTISNGVREGARYASVNCNGRVGGCTAMDVEAWASDRLSGLILYDDNGDSVNASWSGAHRGDSASVSITYHYKFKFFPGITLTEHACSVMRLEQQDTNTGLTGTGTC